MKKSIIKYITIFISVILSVFVISRYSWRLFKFNYCENPNNLYINSIDIKSNNIYLIGNIIESASSFIGYTYKISDKNLYIGLKYNTLTGFFKRDGQFKIKINCDVNQIQKIYLKNKFENKLIWEKNKKNN